MSHVAFLMKNLNQPIILSFEFIQEIILRFNFQAFIIAFTSEFIPKLVYAYVYSKDGTLTGYTNFILSYFDPEDFPTINGAGNREFRSENPETCRYFDYREPPGSDNPYKRKDVFWHVLAARLAFVVIFQVCCFLFYLP